MIVLGAIAAAWIANREARRRGQDPEHVWQLLPWVLVFGIIGARLGWVVVSLKEIEAQGGWMHAFAVWDGGLSIQGAVIGGLLAASFYTRRAGLDFWEWTDIVVPGLALAQAIGRWGNYFNQELFGEPCTQPWCIPIQDSILQSHPQYVQYVGQNLHFAPTFAYEMIWNLLNFALLMWLGRQRRMELRTGDLFWVYGIFYSIGRFFLEDVRLDSVIINNFKPPQAFALITIAICWIGLIYRHRPGSTAPVAVVADDSAAWDEADAEAEDATDLEDATGDAYEVDTDEDGNPVEPVLHPDPIVAQTDGTGGDTAAALRS
jgi:phosphatidylglycerol:prolipoprotein diacylglycerol transferase